MGSEWPRVCISDVCELIVDCVNKTAPTVDQTTPYKMIRTPNVKNGRVSTEDCKFVEKATFEKWTRRAEIKVNDVLLTREAPLGEVGIVKSDEQLFLGQRLMQYRADTALLDPEYLVYAFLSTDLQHQFKMHEGSGSVVSHIRVGDCSKFELNLPPLCTQKRIANILGTLDKKVELNHQINTTLESMAQTLFKSWFVDFDPVIDNALAAGNPIPEALKARADARAALGDKRKPLPDHIRQQFPDRFVLTEEMGWVPEGWRILATEEIAAKIGMGPFGSNIKVSTFVDEGIPVISGHHLNQSLLKDDNYKYITEDHADRLKNSIVTGGDIVFTHAGNIGQVSLIPDKSNYPKYIISQRQFYLRTDQEKASAAYLLYFFRSNQGQHALLSNASQVGVPSIARPTSHLKSIKVLIPSIGLMRLFEDKCAAFFDSTVDRGMQLNTLKQLRDTLLPKLLSGELRVPEAERQVELAT